MSSAYNNVFQLHKIWITKLLYEVLLFWFCDISYGVDVRTVHFVQYIIQNNKCTTYIFVGLENNKLYMMLSTYFEIIDAQQTRMHNIYKNSKLKLLKPIAAIWYQKICKAKQLTPIYTHTTFNGNKIQSKKTRKAAN